MALTPNEYRQLVEPEYQLGDELGSGGMAKVFAATRCSDGLACAIKFLRAELTRNTQAVERFKREGEILRGIEHPAIVKVEDVCAVGDDWYLVMELLRGEMLRDFMLRKGRVFPEALNPIVAGIAAGLHAAHQHGIIHRDLKPENIFLEPLADGSIQIKLLDFGVSKLAEGDKLTATGQILGTPRYMPPEQLRGETVDMRADVYSCGIVFFEALIGRSPFASESPNKLISAILAGETLSLARERTDLEPRLVSIVEKAIAVDREQRFDSVLELAQAWLEVTDPEGKTTQPIGSFPLDRAPISKEDVAAPPVVIEADNDNKNAISSETDIAIPLEPLLSRNAWILVGACSIGLLVLWLLSR